MRIIIQTVLTNLFLLLLLILSVTVSAVPDKPFFHQDESTQNFLFEKGKQFRLFHFNMAHSGADAIFDSNTRLTQWPSLWLNDQSTEKQSFFFQHGPIWIKPFTEYRLTFQFKINAIEGLPPYLQTIFYDYNTDVYQHQDYPLENQPTKGWVEKQIEFQTDGQTYEFRLYLWSTPKGLCDIHFDKIYLEQISEPGALKPSRQILVQGEGFNLSAEIQEELQKIQLPENRETYELDFRVIWNHLKSDVLLTVDWLNEKQHLLGQDLCKFSKIDGIQSKWDGLSTRWTTKREKSSDKASRKLDWHFNTTQTGGESQVKRILNRPEGACIAKISVQKNNKSKEPFLIQDLTLSAEY